MSPPPPPVFPIFLTPPAKESFPVVQSAHEHLRHASDTIHQHRYSLASQLKGFDSRWAQWVTPCLNEFLSYRHMLLGFGLRLLIVYWSMLYLCLCSLFSVAPVLNKLTKGRQRPDEFRKNAQGLDDDVQVRAACLLRVGDQCPIINLIPGCTRRGSETKIFPNTVRGRAG